MARNRRNFTAISTASAIRAVVGALRLPAPVTLAIEGFGRVAHHLVGLLPESCRVAALSTIEGAAVAPPEGWTHAALQAARDAHGDRLVGRIPGTQVTHRDVLGAPVDLLVPAARTRTLAGDLLGEVRAKAAVPIANAPYDSLAIYLRLATRNADHELPPSRPRATPAAARRRAPPRLQRRHPRGVVDNELVEALRRREELREGWDRYLGDVLAVFGRRRPPRADDSYPPWRFLVRAAPLLVETVAAWDGEVPKRFYRTELRKLAVVARAYGPQMRPRDERRALVSLACILNREALRP